MKMMKKMMMMKMMMMTKTFGVPQPGGPSRTPDPDDEDDDEVLGSCLGGPALDVETPLVFPGRDPRGGFGASVAQFGDGDDGWVLVGAPLEGGGQGGLYGCGVRAGSCQRVPVSGPPGVENSSLGLALTAGDGQALVCGPRAPQTCGENLHLRGSCALLGPALRLLRRLPDPPPECPRRSHDIAFLVDGSGSVGARDFGAVKAFVAEVVRRFQGTDTQFSLTQFSTGIQDHFDFRTFRRSPDPSRLLAGVRQQGGVTRTASAIKHVLEKVLVPARGARAGAAKVLIVVTDGQKYGDSLEFREVTALAEAAGVTRYAIGVGVAFSRPEALRELQEIASRPSPRHVFRVDNFEALRDVERDLREQIFNIEGTQSGDSSSFQLEMAQEGFSALLTPEGPVLGAVGAHDWAGGALAFFGAGTPTLINVTYGDPPNGDPPNGDTPLGDPHGAYLGYSSAWVPLGGSRALALGAPRAGHVGGVLLFLLGPGGTWSLLSHTWGTQVGSYFGGALLSLDADGDGRAELLLVGTPNFHGGGGGGRVGLCYLRRQGRSLQCSQVLRGEPGHALGRFGASLAHLGDLDGDGWAEVAVGAPLEDEQRGALYLFRGKRGGVEERHSQRISGSQFPSGPRFLGWALSGGRDLSGDRLPDLAVGAWGQVLLLRAPPLLRVRVGVSFQPRQVPASAFECPENGEGLRGRLGRARICFWGSKGNAHGLGPQPQIQLWFRAELDPSRLRPRGVFGEGASSTNGTLRVGEGQQCRSLDIDFKGCPQDTLTPLTLRVTLGGEGLPLPIAGGLRPQLSPDSDTVTTATLPFEHDCGADNVCEDQLGASFNFSGLETLVVGEGEALALTVTVENRGESSFGAALGVEHPRSLSYRKVEVLQSRRSGGSLRCHSEPPRGRGRHTWCQVSHPVLRAQEQVTFRLTLDVPPDAELGDTLEVTANVTSANGGSRGRGQKGALPVRYRLMLGLSSAPDSTRYVNVSAPPLSADVIHRYQVKVLGSRGAELNVTFQVPSRLGGVPLWERLGVTPEQPQVRCQEGPELGGVPKTPETPQNEPGRSLLLDCHVTACRELTCALPPRDPPQIWGFRVGGTLGVGWAGQVEPPKLRLQSRARLFFDPRRFHNSWGATQAQVETELERVETPNPLPLILGGSLGGLLLLGLLAWGLHKVGFFKRRYKEMMDSGETPQDPPGDPQGDPQA